MYIFIYIYIYIYIVYIYIYNTSPQRSRHHSRLSNQTRPRSNAPLPNTNTSWVDLFIITCCRLPRGGTPTPVYFRAVASRDVARSAAVGGDETRKRRGFTRLSQRLGPRAAGTVP